MIRFLKICAAALLSGVLSSCGQAQQAASSDVPAAAAEAPSQYRVLESFGVGDDVYVRSLAVDAANNTLWVGTSVGVHEVELDTREPLNTFTREQGLANEYVFAMLVDRSGHKWFGTNGGGVTRYKDGAWKTFFPMHGLADYWVYSFGQQASGPLWIGTWYGVNRYDPASGEFTKYVKELVNEWVYGVAVDPEDRVWFATEGGVSRYDGSQWQSWTHQDGLGAPNTDNLPISLNSGLGTRSRHDLSVLVGGEASYNPNYAFCIEAEPDGDIWVGTWGGGVSRFDGKKWTSYTAADGLAGNIVFSMARGQDGVWWFGTNNGVSRYDGKQWQTLRRGDGLFGDSVYAVAVTPDNEVWVGTKRGVARIGR